MAKIQLGNLDENNKYKSKRKSKAGIIVSIITAGVVVGSMSAFSEVNSNNKSATNYFSDIPVVESVSLDDINNKNIIINDSDCSDLLFSDVCKQLKDDGFYFTTTNNCDDINKDNSTIITLDQQYSSGSDTLIFAPYSNTRLGNSDSLAISMQSAFKQNDFSVGDLLCGQVGFEKYKDGKINYYVATDTEKEIDEDLDTSFVTISFGTENNDAKTIAKSIENGLARYVWYLDNYDKNNDLIYNANVNDSIDEVSKYFGTDASNLMKHNNMKEKSFKEAQAVVNPDVDNYEVFDTYTQFNIENTKVHTY